MRLLWVVFIFFISRSLMALPESSSEDLSKVDIYLHTVNVGNLIYNNFGHTAIRIKDRNRGTDLVYNWGFFDFAEPLSFSINFYRGNLIYKLGVYATHHALRAYRYEKRKVWEDRLDFTPQQKKLFLAKIRWNAQPENRNYAYQYFFDNCSTRPRDFIDLALGGRLKTEVQGTIQKTFRDMVREGYQYNPEMDLLLEIGMNGRIDRPMTRWETMFHPLELRKELLKLQVEGQPFISHSKVLVDFPGPKGTSHIFIILGAVLLIPIGVTIYLLQKVAWQKYRQQRITGSIERFGLRLLGVTAVPLVGFLGICGLIMPLNWLFSGHEDLHHNLNMIFFLPTDIIFAILGIYLLIKGKVIRCSPAIQKAAKRYVLLHVALATGGTLSWSMGDSMQDLSRVIYIAVPYIMVLALIVNFGLGLESGSHEQS